MKTEENKMDEMFSRFDGQWDMEEPAAGHEDRFLDRLDRNNRKKPKGKGLIYWIAVPAAAAIAVLLTLLVTFSPDSNETQVAKLSPKTEKTQMYFASIINQELEKLQKENTPETKALVADAMKHMQEMEADYDKITHDLAKKGENKQLIHAMITNLQTRISFLEGVLVKIENIKKIKEQYHENNNA
ncbi:MAG: hypothetical protein DI539_08205 [Flavobacterium psychrophilum]|nr:MAG: hypothetical protein DI539_08205 [Flavobacterium psychrophilum]